eukprot:2329197-Rhodomonas_salina.2
MRRFVSAKAAAGMRSSSWSHRTPLSGQSSRLEACLRQHASSQVGFPRSMSGIRGMAHTMSPQ